MNTLDKFDVVCISKLILVIKSLVVMCDNKKIVSR